MTPRELAELRRTYTPDALMAAYDALDWPEWVPKDPLADGLRSRSSIAQTGRIVAGYVIVANQVLFDGTPGAAAMTALYSYDDSLLGIPEVPLSIARDVSRYHDDERRHLEPSHRQLHKDLHSGFVRTFECRVPPDLSHGHIVFHSSVMAHTALLAQGRLVRDIFPLIISRDTPRYALLVPHSLWPESMRQRWS